MNGTWSKRCSWSIPSIGACTSSTQSRGWPGCMARQIDNPRVLVCVIHIYIYTYTRVHTHTRTHTVRLVPHADLSTRRVVHPLEHPGYHPGYHRGYRRLRGWIPRGGLCQDNLVRDRVRVRVSVRINRVRVDVRIRVRFLLSPLQGDHTSPSPFALAHALNTSGSAKRQSGSSKPLSQMQSPCRVDDQG